MKKINVREKPKGLYKFFSRIPGHLYRLGLSKPFEANTLVLYTKGRKTGRHISITVGFGKIENKIYIAALYESSDWYQNVLKNPEVELKMGRKKMKAQAFKVEDPNEKAKAYRAIVRTQGKKGAEKYYYVKPGMSEEEIGGVGKGLPIMRFEIKY